MTKYRKVSHAFGDLQAGLERARQFYSEMKNTVESLSQNVTTFVGNRKAEGGDLLTRIEKKKNSGSPSSADQDNARLSDLMGRMNVASPPPQAPSAHQHRPAPLQNVPSYTYNPAASPPLTAPYAQSRGTPIQSPYGVPPNQQRYTQPPTMQSQSGSLGYNPNHYGPVSPPATQSSFAHPPSSYSGYQSPPATQQHHPIPSGYVPPPPPPGPPPPSAGQSNNSNDPWAALSGWK